MSCHCDDCDKGKIYDLTQLFTLFAIGGNRYD